MAKQASVLIKLKDQVQPISAKVDTTNKHDIDNWLMGRRYLTIFVQGPGEAPYGLKCMLGADLGKTAQISFFD